MSVEPASESSEAQEIDEDVKSQEQPPEGSSTVDSTEDDAEDDFSTESDFDPAKVLKKLRKQNSELKNLRDRAKQAEQKVEQTSEDKDKEISNLQTQLLRERVGRKTGLPDQLVERLKGDDEESMLKDAEDLLEVFTKSRPPTAKPHEQLRGGGRPESEPVEQDVRKIGARMFDR